MRVVKGRVKEMKQTDDVVISVFGYLRRTHARRSLSPPREIASRICNINLTA
jgi:hypothetical protein